MMHNANHPRHETAPAWLGGIFAHRLKALGVEHFGQTGTVADLFAHHGLDRNAIAHAAEATSAGRPLPHLQQLF
jgi:pyruvate dehydrogenase E1 component